MSIRSFFKKLFERITLPLEDFRRIYAPGSIEVSTPKYVSPLDEVREEMKRQIAIWGQQNHPSYTQNTVCNNIPLADVAKRICEWKAKAGLLSWSDIFMEEVLEAVDEAALGDLEKLRTELIQCAAVALSWVESIDRNYH